MNSSHKKRFGKTFWIILSIIVVLIIFGIRSDRTERVGMPRVGLVSIEDTITDSREVVKQLNHFRDRDDVSAIVLRLETPGGAVGASQEIFAKVKEISQNYKPVVATMGNVAASGGYYIALGADSILANPGTATGSIGVIMGYPVANELMQKLGVDYEIVKSGLLKDAGSTFREATAADRDYFQALIDNLHQQFVTDVATARRLPVEEVAVLATGAVYSGEQALALGLIDRLGTYEDAVNLAGELAGEEERPFVVKPPEEPQDFMDRFLDRLVSKGSRHAGARIPMYKLP